MTKTVKLLILIGLIIYWISPIDLIPGNPIDDIILTIVCFLVNRKALQE